QAKEAKDAAKGKRQAYDGTMDPPTYLGTVGAVALDSQGHIAAATSTGGMTNKRYGRVGDSPLIGAGTWADERCAVSGTGWGEFFIRNVVAHDIAARVAYRGDSLALAAEAVIMERVPQLGGDGGAIAVDRDGNIAMPFSTAGMYRGWIAADGARGTAIFAD
ncbi:MAG: isoaspartyl peptidase/L-asparaginase, partial [Pseudoxanthomonas sp.]